MGASQSNSAGNDRSKRSRRSKKQNPIKSEPHSNGPIRDEQRPNGQTKSKAKRKQDKNLNQPIETVEPENQPIREKSRNKGSTSTVDKATNTDQQQQDQNQKRKKDKKHGKSSGDGKSQRNGGITEKKSVSKDKKSSKTDERDKNLKQQPKRLSHRKQKEQIEKEKKQQRVTKEQLRSLASSLKRTSWYLGRRLGMDDAQAKRYDTSFATEVERKYQMLLWWRRVRGWKATAQQLVILLELGQYTEEEYSAILTSSNGDVTIYDKAPEIAQDVARSNDNREPYHSDVIKPNGNSYGNMAYEDAVQAQVYEKKDEENRSERKEKRQDRKREHQKHRSRHRSKETNYNTLPPWWKKPGDTLERRTPDKLERRTPDTLERRAPNTLDRRTQHRTPDTMDRRTPDTLERRTRETLDRQTPVMHDRSTNGTLERKKKRRSEEVIYAEIKHETKRADKQLTEKRAPQDGTHSNTSHTDDSGIVTSPPMSPKPLETESNDQPSTSQENRKKSSKKNVKTGSLIVRRCSDSVVKLRYTSPLDEAPLAAKPDEPTIAEDEPIDDDKQGTSRDNQPHTNVTKGDGDVTRESSDVTRTNNDTIKRRRHDGSTDDDSRRKHRSSRKRQSRDSKSYDDIDSDVTNSNNDITKQGYQQDIKGMIQKYESLTKLHKAQNRESMALSIQRHWEATNNTLPREYSHQSQYASRSSLSSTGSRSTARSKTSSSRHRRSSKYLQRYHFFSFGGKGRFPSRFKGLISGLAILRNGNVVASDGDNKRIQIFDKHGRFQTTFDTNTELKPKGIGITPDGKIAVCCGDSVNVYDREGHLHLTFGKGVFQNNSYSICCDTKGNYYVTDISSHTVSVHDINGKIRKRFGFLGTTMIHFNQPVSVAINKKNQLYITDSQNHCIKVYTLSGRPLFRIGAKGSSDGLLWNPLGTCFDENDHLFVADCGNNRISEFDSDGNFVRQVLTEEDGIWMPSLVKVNKLGQLVICEWEKQLIKVFTVETAV